MFNIINRLEKFLRILSRHLILCIQYTTAEFVTYPSFRRGTPTRRKEKCLIKFKTPQGVQQTLSLMGKVRNIFAIDVGRYTKEAPERKVAFATACAIWAEATQQLLCA